MIIGKFGFYESNKFMKWEYLVVEGPAGDEEQKMSMTDELNIYGNDGWELVESTFVPDRDWESKWDSSEIYFIHVFKRPKP